LPLSEEHASACLDAQKRVPPQQPADMREVVSWLKIALEE